MPSKHFIPVFITGGGQCRVLCREPDFVTVSWKAKAISSGKITARYPGGAENGPPGEQEGWLKIQKTPSLLPGRLPLPGTAKRRKKLTYVKGYCLSQLNSAVFQQKTNSPSRTSVCISLLTPQCCPERSSSSFPFRLTNPTPCPPDRGPLTTHLSSLIWSGESEQIMSHHIMFPCETKALSPDFMQMESL